MSSQTETAHEIQREERREREVNPERIAGETSDQDHPTISFVIPTLNEEEGIATCIDRIYDAVDELGVTAEIIVSDSSTDRTPDIARELGATVVVPDEEGYGYAYRYGFAHAKGDYIVMGDADTTYDFSELPKLLREVRDGSADICMGSRLEGEIRDGAMPALHQYVGNPLLTKFLNTFYDAGVSDAHSGFRVFTADALEELALQSDGMEFASEMIMAAGERDLEIAEVPITYHERKGEATLESFRDGWRHVRFMLVHAPDYLFSLPGATMSALGLALLLVSLVNQQIGGVFFGTHTAIAGSLLTILGFQTGSFAVLGSIAADPIRSPSGTVTRKIQNHFRLEHGASLGIALFALGATYTGFLVVRWVASGFTDLPVVPTNMVAFTAMVLGAQLIFTSFFFSLLSKCR